jgi:DNA-binding transcriptional regulator YdaS (Cro superfamily)
MLTWVTASVTFVVMEALEKAIKHMGSQVALAKALKLPGKNPSMTITHWKERGVPAKRVLEIERVTGGTVTRHELRPDLYPRAH